MASPIESNFLSAIAGALVGTLVAFVIAERAKYKEGILQEIKATNAAIITSFCIFNMFFSYKNQHLHRMKGKYDADKLAAHKAYNFSKAGLPVNINFRADLSIIHPIITEIDILIDIVYKNLSLCSRGLAAANEVKKSESYLNYSIADRNSIIEKFKRDGLSQEDLFHRYFSVPYDNKVHDEYSCLMDALLSYCNDGIFFSQILCQDLMGHGKSLRNKYFSSIFFGAIKIVTVYWRKDSLMPNQTEYQAWLNGFKEERACDFFDYIKEKITLY